MAELSKTTANQQSLRKAMIVYPQPIAIAAGQVPRSRSPQERVDACLKAGEVIARYVAALALATFRARDAAAYTEEQVIEPLVGPLSLGHFLGIIQRIAGLQSEHPLALHLSPFRKKRRGERGLADDGFVTLLELRNSLGHELARLSEARAKSILTEYDPESRLVQVLDSLEGILSCPLFLIEDQRLERGQILARRLWLMGDSKDPEPEELVLKQGIHDTRRLYIAVDNRVLRLWTWVVWAILPQQQCYGLLLIDTVKDNRVLYQSLDAIEYDSNGEAVAAMQATFAGEQAPAELIETRETNNLAKLWREEKLFRLEAAQRLEGRMPWDEFDQETVGWYASRLAGGPVESPRVVIQERLFDNHERFLEREIIQALLLFGKIDVVRRVLKREMVDVRIYSGGATRWDQRYAECANVLVCLRAAVGFFARHIGMQDTTMNQLANTTGTADYLAMREALVNLFIHQDYGDQSAAAQVELWVERAIFFNPGFSLVAKERLVEGGKSQARNPLIARALRLIGFAELAGSGIRALQTAWREARRRPPQFESDREANTFTVMLDWRLVRDTYDAVWKHRLGVRLTSEQAQLLNLALDTEGITIEEAASGTGLTIDDAREALHYLQLQVLIEERQGPFSHQGSSQGIRAMSEQLALHSRQGKTQVEGPVECLGMTFENDEKRQEYFLEKLCEKLQDPEFRRIEGFPIGSDEDILAISDPPYYTACPNPFLGDFIKHYGRPYDPDVPYNRKPFAVDVSEGKTDPIYKAHAYHTKVPHLAIVPSILHYIEPGDIVLDGFCGSGMTGVAVQWCGTAPEKFRRELEAVWGHEGFGKPEWGLRRSVQCDLSPAATFIAANYNLPFDVDAFVQEGRQLLDEVERELGWMYETLHTDGKTRGSIEYTVWSEVFSCPTCAGEVVFLDEALDEKTKRVQDMFPCPHCGTHLTKNNLETVFETRLDPVDGCVWKRVTFRPSLISYVARGKKYEKKPDEQDLQLIEHIARLPLPQEIPTNRFPIGQMYHGSRIEPKGFTHVHHFFLPRAAHALAALWQKANSHADTRMRHMLLFFVEQAIWGLSVLDRYGPLHFSQVNRYLTGVYYVASQHAECSPWYILAGKLDRLSKAFQNSLAVRESAAITTGTAAHLELPDNCVDYIFTDPPFGENIYYADLNFLTESWYRVLTNATPEAIVDKAKDKTLTDYQRLMQQCFEEYCRVLKPGRWMTVVFHNSRNAVWNAIQEAMLAAGFVVADVRTLDKQQGSYRQVTSTAVKQDLVISAYKPNGGLENRFHLEAGTEEGVWDFIRTHLQQLPVFVTKNDRAEVIAERQNYLLFDRMVAFHVQRGVTVPMSAAEFYQGLVQRFPERDGMYFLPEQAAEYDKKRMAVKEILQLQLFVTDETSAIQWLKQQLTKKPQSFQEIYPQFLKESSAWQKHERMPDLRDEMLAENFLCYDGKGEVPSQIHSYLSTNFKELRNLPKDAPALRAKAKDRWYVPDPNKVGDLEKLRERALLREFWEYLPPGYKPAQPESQAGFIPGLEPKPMPIPTGKKFKVIRMEAVRAGFKYCYQHRDYRTIIAVARRIPENILQEDQKLYMWYDLACTRSGEEA